MGISFFNYPKRAVIGNYNDVRRAIIKFYDCNKDIISIYEYGSVSAPGVSDLDLIFVLKDEISSTEAQFNLANISTFAQDLVADGTVIKMPLNVFQNIQYFDNLNFHKLSGLEVSINDPTEVDDKFIKLASIIDWVPERILKLTRIINSDEINITNALCVLYSFGYSLKFLDRLLGSSEDSRNLIIETARLRGTWHDIDNPEIDLVECLKNAVKIGIRRLFDYEIYLRSSDDYLSVDFSINHDIDLELYSNHFLHFSDVHSPDFDVNLSSIQMDEKFYVVLSHYFYPHFAILAGLEGKLSKRMCSKIQNYVRIDRGVVNSSYEENLRRKMNLAEQNAEFLSRNNLKTGLIRYGFHF